MLSKPTLVITQKSTSKQNVMPARISRYMVFFALTMINDTVDVRLTKYWIDRYNYAAFRYELKKAGLILLQEPQASLLVAHSKLRAMEQMNHVLRAI